MSKFLYHLAAYAARNPEESTGFIIKILIAVIVVVVMISTVSLEMIGSISDSEAVIDEEFDITKEQLYQDIDAVYHEYIEDLQEKMNVRESQIIADNTEVIEGEDGKEVTICKVTVSKEIIQISYAYVYSYINHKHPVKDGEKYVFDKDEINEFFRNVIVFKERCSGTHYSLYTDILLPEEVAEKYFTEDDEKQMYLVSYDLYASFLDFVNEGSYDSDAGEGTQPQSGNHYTYVTPGQKESILNSCSDDVGKTVLDFAVTKVGYPYSQAKRDSGEYFDCSSLCYYAYKSAGINLVYGSANTAAAIANYCSANGQTVSYEQLQPGDLIFYCCKPGNGRFMGIDHVAIYAGNGKIIDASYSKGYVVYRNVFWKNKIVLCGRPR